MVSRLNIVLIINLFGIFIKGGMVGMFRKKFAILGLIIFDVLFLARTYVISPCVVSGSSMNPSYYNGDRVLVNSIVYGFHPPKHEDVVVVLVNPATEKNNFYIKRVIGLPGDKLEVVEGHVLRNGVKLEESYILEYMFDYMGPIQVPEDSIFVMGDNRNNSLDSRDPKIGIIPYSQIVGRVDLKF